MKFTALPIPGAYLLGLDELEDERGFFARVFCREEFLARGLNPDVVQCSLSFNHRRATLRGMHYQAEPHAEAKLVRCTRGAVYDVVLDLRAGSPTYLQWAAAELSAGNRRAVYVPEGCAHGFQTLEDGTDVYYQMSAPYQPESARGVRWDDPAHGIAWPLPDPVVGERDRSFAWLG